MTSTIQNGEGVERARARRDAKDASGAMYVDGSIYEGMEACLVRSGKTVAHVVNYADAVAIAEAVQSLAREPATADVDWLEVARTAAASTRLKSAWSGRVLSGHRDDSHEVRSAMFAIDAVRAIFALTAPRSTSSSEPAIAEGERIGLLHGLLLKAVEDCRDHLARNKERPAEYAVKLLESIVTDNARNETETRATLAQSSTPPASKGVEA